MRLCSVTGDMTISQSQSYIASNPRLALTRLNQTLSPAKQHPSKGSRRTILRFTNHEG
jgi:hypothetical protein